MSKINFQKKEFSNEYDALADQVVPGYSVACELLEAQMDVLLPANASILVVGSGTGDEIIKLTTRHPNWSFMGVDFSADMLEVARQKLKQHDVTNKIELMQADVADTKYSETYNAAICRLILSHLPDIDTKQMALQAIYDVLLPNSYLSIIDYFSNADPELHEFERECWQARAIFEGCEIDFAKELTDYADSKMNQISPEELLALCKKVGFVEPYQFFQANNTRGYLLIKGNK